MSTGAIVWLAMGLLGFGVAVERVEGWSAAVHDFRTKPCSCLLTLAIFVLLGPIAVLIALGMSKPANAPADHPRPESSPHQGAAVAPVSPE